MRIERSVTNPVNDEQMTTLKGVYRDGTGFDENANLVGASTAKVISDW